MHYSRAVACLNCIEYRTPNLRKLADFKKTSFWICANFIKYNPLRLRSLIKDVDVEPNAIKLFYAMLEKLSQRNDIYYTTTTCSQHEDVLKDASFKLNATIHKKKTTIDKDNVKKSLRQIAVPKPTMLFAVAIRKVMPIYTIYSTIIKLNA